MTLQSHVVGRTVRQTSVVALVVAGLALAGCGGGGDSGDKAAATSSPKTKQSVDKALAAQVPAAIKSDGTIKIGTDATYAPNEFLDPNGKKVVGFDVDVFDAVAQKLGLKTNWTPAPFDAIIPGVDSGKYEIGVSSFTINPERKQTVNMVSYFNAGTQWAAKKGNPTKISPDAACGHKVAVQRGTVQVDDITARSKKCTSSGKKAIGIDQYQGQDQATASVVSGKDDAMLADSPVAAYAVKQTSGQLETLGDIYDSAPYGYVVPKDQTDFAKALSGAVQAVIDDGTYQKILTKWGVEQGAIATSKVNP